MQIKEGRLFEIQNLYYGSYLNFEQIEKLNKILFILAKHMFLDRELLNLIAKENIKVTHLKKASKHNMITIIQDPEDKDSTFYYQLGMGGYAILAAAGKPINTLNVLSDLKDRQKILAMNKFIIKRKFTLLFSELHGRSSDYFFCKGDDDSDVIVYHTIDKDVNTLIREVLSQLVKEYDGNRPVMYTKKELEEKYRFVEIDEKLEQINIKSKRDDSKEE